MYFPILRGRQFELQALRECLNQKILSSKIIPIIEPVKDSSLLKDVVSLFISSKRTIAVLKNPQVGMFANKNYDIGGELKKIANKELMSAFYVDSTFSQTYDENSILICEKVEYLDKLKQCLKDNLPKYVLVPDDREFRRCNLSNETKVILGDGFHKQIKNADYANNVLEMFSSDHLFYEHEGYIGFADYSIIGKEYSLIGFAPTAVAIHIIYFEKDKSFWIQHFVSNTTQGIRNVVGKFGEAVTKFSSWYNSQSVRTVGGDLLDDCCKNEHYPGLGKVKEFSIMHHLELISKYLEDDGI